MMSAWETWETCSIAIELQVPQHYQLFMMAYMLFQTYTGLILLLAVQAAGINIDNCFEGRAAAICAEAILIMWYVVVVVAVMRDWPAAGQAPSSLELEFRRSRFRNSWCCLRSNVKPQTSGKGHDWLALSPFDDDMPDIADLRYHINPYLCKKYLGRDDGNYGNYGICYFCC